MIGVNLEHKEEFLMSEYECVDNVETLAKTLEKVKNAQKEFSKYSQEQVDKIFQAAAIAANEARIPLAKMAVEETGMGIVEDKVIKNHYAAEYIYNMEEVTDEGITLSYEEKQAVEGKKKKQLVKVTRSYPFDQIKYTKEWLDFK